MNMPNVIITKEEAYPVYGVSDHEVLGRTAEVPQETLDRWEAAMKSYDQAQNEMAEAYVRGKSKHEQNQMQIL